MPITPRRMPEMNEAVTTTSASDVETQDRGSGRDRKPEEPAGRRAELPT
jgi:hypothetical protein